MNTFYIAFLVTILSLIITWYYSYSQRKISHEIMLKQLFTEFNDRYSKLNQHLSEIESKYSDPDVFQSAENYLILKQKIIEYFNLCAEEYFWYRKGRIDKQIWIAWNSGMRYWYETPSIKYYWEKEKKYKESYYLSNSTDFFSS